MTVGRVALTLLGLLSAVYACGDDHTHSHARRSSSSLKSIRSPTRPLQWGSLNIIHTTDTHGWLLGHQHDSSPEPNYSGDHGMFYSFVKHMKHLAKEKNVDLLLIDSGDIHDGTGISDGFPEGGTDAKDANEFIKKLPYDVLAIGNHELYVYNNTLDMYNNFGPHWKGRYLSSNANITIPDSSDPSKNVTVPVGNRFTKFTTAKGVRITAFGILFDFTGNDDGTTVQRVEDMVLEPWFLDAISEEPDVFLLAGHMPVSGDVDSWGVVHAKIREVHGDSVPILILGGHAHVRDCVQLDGRSMSLASGRYMETVGWMSVDIPKHSAKSTQNLTFSRRYLDPNRLTYEFHTGLHGRAFDTHEGAQIKSGLEGIWDKYNLSFTFGTAPNDFTLTRAEYPSNGSLPSLFVSDAVPTALVTNNSRSSLQPLQYYLVNTGALRFDLYQGTFDRNDQFTSSPFTDKFLYVEARQEWAESVLSAMNSDGESDKRRIKRSARAERKRQERLARGEVEEVYRDWLADMATHAQVKREGDFERRDDELTLGYVTQDSCPGIGDDTAHTALPFYDVPDYISSSSSSNSSGSADSWIDFVFVDFIEDDVIELLNQLQGEVVYASNKTIDASKVMSDETLSTSSSDEVGGVGLYSDYMTSEVLGVYAQSAWN